MEQENLVIENLKAIRRGIDTMREDLGERLDGLAERVDKLSERVDINSGHLELVAGEIGEVKLHLEWLRARVGAASTQSSVADTGRARLEEKLEETQRRVAALIDRVDRLEGDR